VAQRVDAAEVRTGSGAGRRDVVLIAALETFLRYGYRKTSMEDIASAAHISRPGLYFLFASKRELFAAAITRALEQDLHTAAHALDDEAHLLHERLLEAFDTWTGRYLGAVGGELSAVAEAHRDVLGTAVLDSSHRFHALITDAIVSTRAPQERATSEAIARTLISTAIGLKHQMTSRETFCAHLSTAIALVLR
jgi:AcrR family transcriptional regulator